MGTDVTKPLQVLVIEDSAEDAELLIDALRRGNYDPTYERVETPEAMTAALDRQRWDIVFGDYSMPHFDGVSALNLLRKRGLDIPFIFVSGTIGEDTAVDSMRNGANDYVMKGNFKRLIPAVDRELREAAERRERRWAEAALRQNEDYFQSLIEHSSDIITVIDVMGGILYDSPSVERVLGYRQGALVGQNIFQCVHPDDIPHLMEAVRKGSQELEKAFLVEFRFRHRDGSWRLLESMGRGHRNHSGAVIGIINSRDITRRKRAEEELHAAQAHLLQSEKMASLGQLAAGVAHEINNPVGFVSSNLRTLEEYMAELIQLISGYGSLLAVVERGEGDAVEGERKRVRSLEKEVNVGFLLEDLSRLVAESLDGMERIRQIIKDLKEFSHVDQGERMRMNLNQGIESTLNIVWNELKYKAEVIKELGEIPEILCYPQQINQVFMNLLVNAAHAIRERGKIWIRSRVEGDWIVVEIEDTGCGISEEHVKKIFDPFFTTKPVGKGTGLGLSVSYGIVQTHNGKIEVESAVGKGTKFRLLLPMTAA
ncbi:MAG: ATP-binding protein [Candidatus Manganitrophus sp.]|nr:MAG: ATP-binding protein [Candidatus Manganitrophus sp.]